MTDWLAGSHTSQQHTRNPSFLSAAVSNPLYISISILTPTPVFLFQPLLPFFGFNPISFICFWFNSYSRVSVLIPYSRVSVSTSTPVFLFQLQLVCFCSNLHFNIYVSTPIHLFLFQPPLPHLSFNHYSNVSVPTCIPVFLFQNCSHRLLVQPLLQSFFYSFQSCQYFVVVVVNQGNIIKKCMFTIFSRNHH